MLRPELAGGVNVLGSYFSCFQTLRVLSPFLLLSKRIRVFAGKRKRADTNMRAESEKALLVQGEGAVQQDLCTLVCSFYSVASSLPVWPQGFGCVWRESWEAGGLKAPREGFPLLPPKMQRTIPANQTLFEEKRWEEDSWSVGIEASGEWSSVVGKWCSVLGAQLKVKAEIKDHILLCDWQFQSIVALR